MKSSDFAARLRSLRAERGYSKSSFARAVGVTTTCVWNWEEGNTYPRPEALKRIGNTLGTTVGFLETGAAGAPVLGSDGQPAEAMIPRSRELSDVITQYRRDIAELSGLPMDRVRIVLDFGS